MLNIENGSWTERRGRSSGHPAVDGEGASASVAGSMVLVTRATLITIHDTYLWWAVSYTYGRDQEAGYGTEIQAAVAREMCGILGGKTVLETDSSHRR